MAKKYTGGAAFPAGDGHVFGISARDYFAAKAMAALIAEPPFGEGATATVVQQSREFTGDVEDRFAHVAYRFADAMLRAREQS